MFDRIILLTSPVEQTALSALLLGHNPQLTICPAATSEDLAALNPSALTCSRLIAFSSPVIVPRGVLGSLGYGAYNFHPGPPQYPGWAPAHFALYEHASEFGATAHAMDERVDSGPIVDVALFQIPADISVLGLERLAYAHLARLFWELSKRLATQVEPLPVRQTRWGEKKKLAARLSGDLRYSARYRQQEFDHRMRIFGGNHFGMSPTIRLHGVEFRAVS
jgi:methionyl-tRNA formyltransferase